MERLPLDERRRRIRAAQRAATKGAEPARGADRVSALSVVVSGLLALVGLGFAVLAPAARGTDNILPAGWAVVVSMFVAGGAAFVAVVQLVSGGRGSSRR
jgi:hypothetical protein